ncbi:MAG: peroxiredoxin family protein [Acidobacteriota bacterium]
MVQLEPAFSHFSALDCGIAVIDPQKLEGYGHPKQFLEKHRFPFPILFDEDRLACKAYGVYRPVGLDAINAAHPATFFVDPGRIIRTIRVSSNQRDLPSAQQLLDELGRLQSSSRGQGSGVRGQEEG